MGTSGIGEHDVFLSYATADAVAVERLRVALVAVGLRVWMDSVRVESSSHIPETLKAAIASSRVFVAFYSDAYPKRPWCLEELLYGWCVARTHGDPGRRVFAVNGSESGGFEHIVPARLRATKLPSVAVSDGWPDEAAALVKGLVEATSGPLASLSPAPVARYGEGANRSLGTLVGRLGELWRIDELLHIGETTRLATRARAETAWVVGMGGIGKTMLVDHYVESFSLDYPGGIFRLNAQGDPLDGLIDLDGLEQLRCDQFRRIAFELRLLEPGGERPVDDRDDLELPEAALGVVGQDEVELRLVEHFRRLERAGRPALWVVDDVPSRLDQAVVERWLAPGGVTRSLATARTTSYTDDDHQLRLQEVSPEDAIRLLDPTGRYASDERLLREIISRLGGHTLALAIAAGCLVPGFGPQEFLDFFDDPGEDILDDGADGFHPTPHERSIEKTLARSIQALSDTERDVLRLASVLAQADIPIELVTETLAPGTSRLAVTRAMTDLERLSLARFGASNNVLSVHQLVLRTIRRTSLDRDRSNELRTLAISAIVDHGERGSHWIDNAMPHVETLLGDGINSENLPLVVKLCFNNSGQFWTADGGPQLVVPVIRSTELRALSEKVVDYQRRSLGAEHPETLDALSTFAAWCDDPVQSREIWESLVEAWTRLHGAEHLETLNARSGLARTYAGLGENAARALEIRESLVEAWTRLQGADDPRTLDALSDLAYVYARQGEYERAREIQESLVEVWTRLQGADDPRTLNVLNGLANTYARRGEYERAREILESLVEVWTRLQGVDHPQTLNARSGLASTYARLGERERAREIRESLVEARTRLQGTDDQRTLGAEPR